MTEELNQKISQLIDNDLDKEEALKLLKKMNQDNVLQAKLSRYETIGHAIKSDVFLSVDTDFAMRVSLAIEKEPIHLMPKPKTKFIPNSFAVNKGLAALAASVAIIAVVVSHGLHSSNPGNFINKTSLIIASNGKGNPASILVKQTRPVLPVDKPIETREATVQPTVSRFAEYLQAHNSTRYIDGGFERQPYTRVASYRQE